MLSRGFPQLPVARTSRKYLECWRRHREIENSCRGNTFPLPSPTVHQRLLRFGEGFEIAQTRKAASVPNPMLHADSQFGSLPSSQMFMAPKCNCDRPTLRHFRPSNPAQHQFTRRLMGSHPCRLGWRNCQNLLNGTAKRQLPGSN